MKKCPFCRDKELQPVQNMGSLHRCPQCRRRFYISVCWSCHAVIFKLDVKRNHCPVCNWYLCDNCYSCSLGCTEAADPLTGQGDFSSDPMPDYTTTEVSDLFDEARQFFPDCTDDIPPADDGDDVRLEDEIPDACWLEWSEEDSSAYAE
jgi:hypothetical protein